MRDAMEANKIRFYPGPTNVLAFLEPVIGTTFTIVERYLALACKDGYLADRPFAYNERATLSLFTGGIWQSDHRNLVLEEYASSKTSEDISYRGRDDMWFQVDRKTCYGEAKQQWISTSKPETGLAMAKQTLESEFQKASFNKRTVDFTLGILFLIPQLTSRQRAKPREFLESFYSTLNFNLLEFAAARSFQLVWGSFLDERFLGPEAFCFPGKHADLSYPGFEIIVCTKPDGPVKT